MGENPFCEPNGTTLVKDGKVQVKTEVCPQPPPQVSQTPAVTDTPSTDTPTPGTLGEDQTTTQDEPRDQVVNDGTGKIIMILLGWLSVCVPLGCLAVVCYLRHMYKMMKGKSMISGNEKVKAEQHIWTRKPKLLSLEPLVDQNVGGLC